MKLPVLLTALTISMSGLFSSFATNDLLITSISRVSDCTTLKWLSNTGEWYAVQWTDNLVPPVFWRVAQANVSSGGTNTTWREGCCAGESMMMSSFSSGGWSSLSEKEQEEKLSEMQERSAESVKFLNAKLQEATNRGAIKGGSAKSGSGGAALSSAPSLGGGGTNTNNTATVTTARFYRVAKIAAGFVDGWGAAFGADRPAISNVIAVSASPRFAGVHGMALRADGTVTNWGANSFGQCNVPTNLTDVIAVAAGGRHSVALKRDHTVVSWGDNLLGQITNAPTNLTNVVDVKAGLWHTLALRADGTVAAWGDLFNRSNSVPFGLSGVTAISAGPRHNLALKCDGTVVAWGFTLTNLLDNFLPTNVPSSLSNVLAISAGMEHNQALLADGIVRVWGHTNNPGVIGALSLTNVTALSAGWHYGAALLADTTTQGWGQGDGNIVMADVIALSTGADHVLVVRTNDDAPVVRSQPRDVLAPTGTVATLAYHATSAQAVTNQWQRRIGATWVDLAGQTNFTLTFASLQDSDIGTYRALAGTSSRAATSRSATVETIHAPEISSQTPELNLLRRQDDPSVSLSVIVTNARAVALRHTWYKDGVARPFSFGNSFYISFFSPESEGAYHVVVSNAAGRATSAVWQVSLTLHGETRMWGDSTSGQRTGLSRQETNLVAVSAGGYHTLGLRENGTVVAWGDNNAGQTNVPTGLTNVIAVAGGGSHSLALLENGTVRAWGNDLCGQTNVPTGLTNVTAIAAGGPQSLALRSDGRLIAWGCTPVPAGVSNIAAVAAGPQNALALLSNGTVQAWNSLGATDLTPPAGLSNVVALDCDYSHALALKRDGTVVAWGENDYGQTNVPAGLSNVMKVVTGTRFSLALKNDGSVVSWGRNDDGQTNVPPGMGDIQDLAAGIQHSVALAYNDGLEYPVNVAQDVLLIYNSNTNFPDSTTLKNYYVAHRPFMNNALQFAIDGPGGEFYGLTNAGAGGRPIFTNTFLSPLLAWYAANPTIRPRYLICFLDVPRWVLDNASLNVSHTIREALPHRPPFVHHLDMGAAQFLGETNRLADCFAYVDKLARFASNYSPGKVIISASAGGYDNDQYFLDDVLLYEPSVPNAKDVKIYDGYLTLLAQGVNSNLLNYTYDTNLVIRYGTNLAGYMSHGSYGWAPYFNLPPRLSVQFRGDSEWYIMATAESFNGLRERDGAGGMADYAELFSSGSFGRTNYLATPVGTVGHIFEPGTIGVNDPTRYFTLWQQGHHFAFCARHSQRTRHMVATGDPLVRR